MKKQLQTNQVFKQFQFSQAEYENEVVMPDYPFIKEVVHEILLKYKGKGLLMVDRSNMEDLVANLEYTHLKKKVVDADTVDQRNLKI